MNVIRILLLVFSTFALASDQIIYPSNEARYSEYIEILRSALEKTKDRFGSFTMKPSTMEMTETRFLIEARKGKTINVVWSATSPSKESSLLPIRIPLTKGLLGFRIALIRSEQQPLLDKIRTAEDLRKLKFGLGFGWGDVDIFQGLGAQIIFAHYTSLFKLLATGRIDIFPRGINEIFSEFEAFKKDNPNLIIEKNLLIYYPYPFYFFVTPQDRHLADRIELGLQRMLKDGTYDAIFMKHNGDAIAKANIKNRRVIILKNPNITNETPVNTSPLWYKPEHW